MILCPHETIISKSEADFDTQRRRRAPRDLEGSVATLLRLPNRFAPLAKVCVVTHFIIVGGFSGVLQRHQYDGLERSDPIYRGFEAVASIAVGYG